MRNFVSLWFFCAFNLFGSDSYDSDQDEMKVNSTIPDDDDDDVFFFRLEYDKLLVQKEQCNDEIRKLDKQIAQIHFMLEKYNVENQNKLREIISPIDQECMGQLLDIPFDYPQECKKYWQEEREDIDGILGYGLLTLEQVAENIKNRPRRDVFTMMSMF